VKTLNLTNAEAEYLKKLVGKTEMGKTGKYYPLYEKLVDLVG
jgi:hypothetical protein